MDFFAAIYDTLFSIWSQKYSFIFTTLFSDGGYFNFSLLFTLIPLACWLIFYFVWRYPYGKWWHWLLWLLFTALLVMGATYGIARNEILVSSNPDMISCYNDPDCFSYAESLPFEYTKANGILSIFISIILSFVLKQFSKIQTHLPF